MIRRRRKSTKIDRIWKKYYLLVLVIYALLCIVACVLQARADLRLQKFCINLDAPFTDKFYHWRTDGLPGEEPPRN